MESEDTEREERALDALFCMTLIKGYEPSEEEMSEFMGDDPPLSSEDKKMLTRVGDGLPSKMAEWKAKRDGCMIIEDERSHHGTGQKRSG